jgi:hypothetical protein
MPKHKDPAISLADAVIVAYEVGTELRELSDEYDSRIATKAQLRRIERLETKFTKLSDKALKLTYKLKGH